MDLSRLIEWYSKILSYAHSYLSRESGQRLATAATERAVQYGKDHPYATAFSVVSFGLTPILGAQWMTLGSLKVIGFGPLGPYAGSIAAWYQSTYLGGYIPAGSIFSGLQRFAMAKL